MRWRIYYGDGSTFSDRDGEPFDAPSPQYAVIVQEAATPRGFLLIHGKDYAYWRPDLGWQGCDWGGLWDYLLLYRGPKAVLGGRTLRDERFYAILRRAQQEGLAA